MSAAIDVAVVGAGAAGVGAGLRLAELGLSCVLLEARDRVGGRAHTQRAPDGAALDLGCEWLHAAHHNPWVERFTELGLEIERAPAPWTKPAVELNFPPKEQRAFSQAFGAFEKRLARAALEGPDRRAADFLEPGGRWNAMLNVFSGVYNGASFREVSVKDYAAYDEEGADWRVRGGYGAAIARAAHPLDVRLGTPVTKIEHGARGVRVHTSAGIVEAGAAIVTLPTDVLAAEAVGFDPPMPDKLEAAAALPLGHAAKVWFEIADADDLPLDRMLWGRTDSERTASHHLRPLGRPLVESYFGGDLATELERAGEAAMAAFAVDELAAVFGANIRTRLTPLAASQWSVEPWSLGAYSHARVGSAAARTRLAEPAADRLFFAGEACSAHAFSTAHGAYQTGMAAAEAASAALRR